MGVAALAIGMATVVSSSLQFLVAQQPLLPQVAAELQEPAPSEPTPSVDGETSEAERVASLQEAIEHDQKQLADLEKELDNPNSEYEMAENDFRAINEELEKTTEQLQAAKTANNSMLVERLEKEIVSIERQRKLAEDRFDLAIEDRKTIREQRATLRRKIEHDQEALNALLGQNEGSDGERNDPDAAQAKPNSLAPLESDDRFAAEKESNGTSRRHSDEESNHRENDIDRKDSDDEHPSDMDPEQDEELTKAAAEAEAKEQQAKEAEEETQSIAARLADIQKLVAQEQKELDLARRKVELATSALWTLNQESERRQSEQADATELAELKNAIGKANQRILQARLEVSEISERLNDHRAELSGLQSEHILALHEMQQKKNEAEAADDLVASLRNPFTLRNITHWLVEHGPRLLAIAIGMFVLNRLASFFANRCVRLVSSGTGRGSTVERENRAKTLVGVFQNAASVGVCISGSLMILEEIGANITVLMGGVAVIGLAVAFGAQNLIKDYFYGFVMLLENQYMLNDSVRIGGVSGQVERITLRMTVLRDSNGVVHFIPNGTINSVSNETHGWSRAVCEVSVSHREDLVNVIDLLRRVGQELKADPKIGSLMLDVPSEPAIESLGDVSVHLKVAVKTQPNKHGAVRQEWLKRIRAQFVAAGIESSMPQSILVVQKEDRSLHASLPGIADDAWSVKRAG
jgi:small conductance mechanosensitive channel